MIRTVAVAALLLAVIKGCASTEPKPTAAPQDEPAQAKASDETERDTADKPKPDAKAAADEATTKPAKPIDPTSEVLKHWRLVDDIWFDAHGKVYEKDGSIILEAGEPATGISWLGKLPRSNYEITLEGMRVEGSDFFCGLTFPVGESSCTLILGGWGGWVVGLSNVDGMHAAENETTRSLVFKNKRWYDVKLRVTDDRIRVWIDDEPQIDLERSGRRFDIWVEQDPIRPLGIATWYTKAAIRNFKLRRVKVWP